jgi:hypothetical protein
MIDVGIGASRAMRLIFAADLSLHHRQTKANRVSRKSKNLS